MTTDPAKWLPELVSTKWGAAVQSLAADGITTPKALKPIIAASGDKNVAAVKLGQGVLVKAYQATDAKSTLHTWGMNKRDRAVQWALDISTGGPAARELMHAAALVVDRILILHRKDPHADWDQISTWQENQAEDYWDWQHRVFTLQLDAFNETMATAIKDVV